MKQGMLSIIVPHLSKGFRMLWDEIKKVLPKEKSSKTVGRPIVPYRKVMDGILYVLRTRGCQWKMLPKEHGSGSTYHRQFQEWNGMDVFKNIWIKLLKIYDGMIGINWTWQSIDSISIKSLLGGGHDCRKQSYHR